MGLSKELCTMERVYADNDVTIFRKTLFKFTLNFDHGYNHFLTFAHTEIPYLAGNIIWCSTKKKCMTCTKVLMYALQGKCVNYTSAYSQLGTFDPYLVGDLCKCVICRGCKKEFEFMGQRGFDKRLLLCSCHQVSFKWSLSVMLTR